ncbi:MAG: thiamine-phosphate kinase [Spirochaetes bacterium]|nr:thiamine-phosphate kinase [Spirochaetota bacterium]
MNEFKLIHFLTRHLKKSKKEVICSIGDDTSVLQFNQKEYHLLTVDTLVENIHFSLQWKISKKKLFYMLGWKAMAVNVSDILAMGGESLAGLVSLSIPPYIKLTCLDHLYQGIGDFCKKYHINIVGGNITSNRHCLFIDIMLLGRTDKKRLFLRKNARVNDFIYTQKDLGESAAGMICIRKNIKDVELIHSHLMPSPFINWKKLEKYRIHAAIDISDGLLGDLSHILEQSGKGADIDINRVPLSKKVKALFPARGLSMALNGGEEYKILFTSPDEIKDKNLVTIGRITKKKGLRFFRGNKQITFKNKGFLHFK